ncbi:MAG: 1-acyl-sn-glycerol-3-phosphate acyltransferase [Acidobacteria bacterium]|nr:1-acyl-sn-glycerol-3-phosphate acyltransferase [Acidobacteriota bacterium]
MVVLSGAAFRFGWLWVCRRGALSLRDRALWASGTSRRMLRAFGVDSTVSGEPPPCGLLVSNHLGYFDIFLYSALAPCIFISKDEVRSWPLLGYLARFAGTVFINRGSARDGSALLAQIEAPLREGCVVMCFPESASTDGSHVRPFHPLLFEAAIRAQAPITPAAVSFRSDALPEDRLAYWGDDTLLPHLLQATSPKRVRGQVKFGAALPEVTDRKRAAAAAHRWVADRREEWKETEKESAV